MQIIVVVNLCFYVVFQCLDWISVFPYCWLVWPSSFAMTVLCACFVSLEQVVDVELHRDSLGEDYLPASLPPSSTVTLLSSSSSSSSTCSRTPRSVTPTQPALSSTPPITSVGGVHITAAVLSYSSGKMSHDPLGATSEKGEMSLVWLITRTPPEQKHIATHTKPKWNRVAHKSQATYVPFKRYNFTCFYPFFWQFIAYNHHPLCKPAPWFCFNFFSSYLKPMPLVLEFAI